MSQRLAIVFNTHISHARYEHLAAHLKTLLFSSYGIQSELFCLPQTQNAELDDHLRTEFSAVLPMHVPDAEYIERANLPNSMLSPSKVLNQLDDKSVLPTLSVFQEQREFLPFVPTVQTSDVDHSLLSDLLNKHDRFIVKSNTADVSTNQHHFTRDELAQFDLEQFPNYSVQPNLSPHSNYSCVFLAKDGKLDQSSFHIYAIPQEFYKQSQKNLKYPIHYVGCCQYQYFDTEVEVEKLLKHCSELTDGLSLNGIFNLEFLHYEDSFYFLEVNPRYSGNIFCYDKDGRHPYLDKVIVPYVQQCGLTNAELYEEKFRLFDDQFLLYDTTSISSEKPRGPIIYSIPEAETKQKLRL